MSRTDRSPHACHWMLDPEIDYLNHGSFGACPAPVLEAQQALRVQLERQPVRFFLREMPGRMAAARACLADFLGADPEGLAVVRNATQGVNTVLRNLRLSAGDEILVTDHEYAATRNAIDAVTTAAGARAVVVELPLGGVTPERVVERVVAAVTPRTRLAVLDHVTSQTGLILPLASCLRGLDALGVDVLVDGAHGPGMLDLNLRELAAAFYTGNCHKWICAPKGAAFLHVREDRRDRVRPLSISHGATSPVAGSSRFHAEFDWTGTDDPTPFLVVPEAIRFLGGLYPGGWPELRRENRRKTLRARRVVAESLEVPLPCDDAMIGSIASLPLPDAPPGLTRSALETDGLQDALFERHGIEVPVMVWPAPPRRLIRVSCQAYNDDSQYVRLADALPGVLERERTSHGAR